MNDNNKKPKLTLGLKKKVQSENERPKLTLGLRKKPALVQRPQIDKKTTISKPKPEKPKFISDYATPKLLNPNSKPTIKIPKTQGRLEVSIKITELPNWVETIKRNWKRFCVNGDGQIVQIVVRPRVWDKMTQADKDYPEWVANITGKMGPRIKDGFVLLEPAIQVYEKIIKPKPELNK